MKRTFVASKTLLACLFFVSIIFSSTEIYCQDILYGMTQYGGMYNTGVPYQVNVDGTNFFSFRDFDGIEGGYPGDGARFSQISERNSVLGITTLVGNFAGLTASGYFNTGYGNRVQVKEGTSGLTAPYLFKVTTTTGTNPAGGFLAMTNGRLYGLMSKNGQYGGGTLFSTADVLGNGITVLASFNGANTGRSPKGTPILGTDGRLYGTTELGGVNDLGVVFSFDITKTQQKLVKLIDFDGVAKGSNPTGNLLLASDGRLYGMTKNGGIYGHGVIFSILSDGSGYFKLMDLNGSATGSHPKGSLTQFTDGNLYGMTSSGGAYGFGTIFRISLNGTYNKILDFDGANGKAPVGDLLVDTSGTNMYGTTYAGGSNDQGVLFRIQNGTHYTKLYDYNVATGSNPVGALAMTRNQFRMGVEPIPDQIAGSAPFTPTIVSEVDMPVYFASSDTSVVSVENNKLIFKTSGNSLITAFQLGTHEYLGNFYLTNVSVKKASQAIAFNPLPVKTFGDVPFTVTAVASSGLPATFSSSNASIATVDGNKITIKGAGHFTITANQSGNQKYEIATPVQQHLFVERAAQTITFNPVPTRTCCYVFALFATSSAGPPVLFKSSDLMKLRTNETSAQPLDVGNVDIIAYQPGNTNYKPAERRASVEILKGFETFSFFESNTPHRVGDPPVVAYASSSNLPVTFTSDPPGIAVVEKGLLYFLAEGTTTITAVQSGNERYYPAPPISLNITVGPPTTPGIGNTISFPDLVEKTMVDSPFNLTAIATSGLPVSYISSNSSVAEINGNLVTIKGTGATTITASQTGKEGIAPAQSVVKELRVGKKSQFIPFILSSSVMFGIPPIALPATTSEGLPINYGVSDNSLGSIENYYLTIKGNGNLTITASQPGNELYMAAPPVNATITIHPIYDDIYFKPLSELTYGDEPFDLEAWASSGLPLTFASSNATIASVSGSSVTIKAAGTVTLSATSTNPGYRLTQSQKSVLIRKAQQTITFAPLEPKKFGDPSFLVSASSTSGLPLTFITSTPDVVRVEGDRIIIVGNGLAEIIAAHAGDGNYEAAESVHQEFLVTDAGKAYELVGTTTNGGSNHSGVVFSMNSEGTSFGHLKQFAAKKSPSPRAGFMKGVDGKLYGTFSSGGTGNVGSIVRLEADGTGFTYLHHLSSPEGERPVGNLIQTVDGYLYGTTSSGGVSDGGTIFRLKPDGTEFKVIYNFSALTGKSANNVIQGIDGKLYGITQGGGFYGRGTIYSILTDGNGFSILFHLNDNSPLKSGGSPHGGLVQGPDEFLYGTNSYGGDNGYGTLFKIRSDGSGFTKLVQFNGTTTGGFPGYEVLFGSDGKIYGMTASGGTHEQGTIFSVNPDGTNFAQLFSFEDTDTESSPLGSNPFGKLTEGTDGLLYGTTAKGGSSNNGTIFKIGKDGSAFQILVNLDERASYPYNGPLLESTPGVFFGMTSAGGSLNGGAIFKVSSSAEFSIINDFPQEQTSPRNLISDPTGDYYYGITQANSEIEGGSIFRVDAAGLTYDQIYQVPTGEIITTIFYASTGHLWVSGVHANENFMFRMKPDGSAREDITSYNTALAQKRYPVISLVETPDGELFGATDAILPASIFFKIKNDGSGFMKLLELGGRLTADLVLGSDGNFYLAYGKEGIFKVTPSGSISNIFVHPYPSDNPQIKKIIEMNGGRLAAVTSLSGSGGVSGARNRGTIFSIDKDGGDYRQIYEFVSTEVTSPVDMIQSMDGWLYVVSEYGGLNKKGLVYKLTPDGSSFTKIRDFNAVDGENPSGLFFRRVPQSFSFQPLQEKKASDPAFLPTIVTSSGAPVILSSANPNIAIIENGRIKPVGAGTTMIVATLYANANYYGGGRIEQQLIVTKGTQTITFNYLPPSKLQDAMFDLTAVSTSALPVSYQSSNPAVASISGSTVTLHTFGSTTITALQEGNDEFFAAPNVSRILVIHDASQSIAFSNPGNKVLGDPAFDLSATSSSGLDVSYSTTSDKILIDGSRVTILKAGMVTISANQSGDNNFEPAVQIDGSFCINPPQPVITESGQFPDLELHSSNEIGNQWYLNNEAIVGYVAHSIVATDEGTYTVATSIDGCESERSSPWVFITTSIEELLPQINLYPNPATRILYVEIPGNITGTAHIELLDGTGRTLESRRVPAASKSEFDLREFRNGLLLVKIVLGEKTVMRKILTY